ncbi:DNA-processing protein DprA [Anaplasma marginale]|uniref:DNA-processing protein DprA n=1 Tax=Anaplasma marginale TaxID=770 RepID=UPI0011EC7FD2|nr:DNA-processing protein DprA [Anaplasma marginale]TZF79319.1 DNA-protecting protein DprA [Anaplasma marginale]
MDPSTNITSAAVIRDCLVACIRIMRTAKIGPIAFQKLIKLYKTPELALDALAHGELGNVGRICPEDDAKKEVELCRKLGARMISMFEREYPQMLLHIYDPPPVITALGDVALLNKNNKIAIVGSRNASANGKRIAYGIAFDLSKAGFVTVSGLARGIDSTVHSVILEKMPTVAVTASGIDVVYPKDNLHLYRAIVHNGGVVVTELPFSSLPKASFFPQRNRIISGMAWGTVVVEASRRSGSLITANFALSQGREVFAVPGLALDPKYSGSNYLIKQGATLVESAEDIIQALNPGARPIAANSLRHAARQDAATDGAGPAAIRRAILQQLSVSPTDIEDLAACTKIGTSTLLAELIELELLRKVHRFPGNRFALSLEN